jgi:hypothetical protein
MARLSARFVARDGKNLFRSLSILLQDEGRYRILRHKSGTVSLKLCLGAKSFSHQLQLVVRLTERGTSGHRLYILNHH